MKVKSLFKRRSHISKIDRQVSENQCPEIFTIDGLQKIMITKPCNRCRTTQPINNFYFKSKKQSQKFDQNDPKSRRHICIPCWDELNR